MQVVCSARNAEQRALCKQHFALAGKFPFGVSKCFPAKRKFPGIFFSPQKFFWPRDKQALRDSVARLQSSDMQGNGCEHHWWTNGSDFTCCVSMTVVGKIKAIIVQLRQSTIAIADSELHSCYLLSCWSFGYFQVPDEAPDCYISLIVWTCVSSLETEVLHLKPATQLLVIFWLTFNLQSCSSIIYNFIPLFTNEFPVWGKLFCLYIKCNHTLTLKHEEVSVDNSSDLCTEAGKHWATDWMSHQQDYTYYRHVLNIWLFNWKWVTR